MVELNGTTLGEESPSQASVDAALSSLRDAMQAVGAEARVLRSRPATRDSRASTDVWVRCRPGEGEVLEVHVAVIGNVDSGKSTLVGVLTHAALDDGRGSARARVFTHGHEQSTGRTSSIGQHSICLDASGTFLNDAQYRPSTASDYVARAAKIITLVDLAGHTKYFKTTASGLTGHLPDYAAVVIGANAGVIGMCKEHLGVALALQIPTFFVVTKVDLAPAHVAKHSLETLTTILKHPSIRKKPFMIRSMDDVITCAKHLHTSNLAPIFVTSCVSGAGLDLIRTFLDLLPQRHQWSTKRAEGAQFMINEVFGVPGVGTVVSGTVRSGVIVPGSVLALGPDVSDGTFKPCAVKSVHFKRLPVDHVVAGQTASLALKKVKRSGVRRGMILADPGLHCSAGWEFEAEIAVLTHSTTIQTRYQAVIHCEAVRQSAQVVGMDRDRLRSGDRATVRFRFLQHPEYLTPGARFVFREGKTKGVGRVVGFADEKRKA
ncbi:hypothetical protein APUTEX25_003312 [Auxenochlorella protothecoides]|uniref:Tr-type G domain-containing protein n=1 Tax=Auxenochlorella protothecoides TaxID=3075 RepID=A0A3M7KUQ7_AUXPR|nr:hypothetical protein APUTEX25_003312 [Auxenochlorella protothecoides]|eukprot:RMZ53490.1 hypothetical protein APUTEX25_003312 [Auxenochlorella protothecoides]